MPEPDEGWNAFDEAKAEALQQSEQFPDICKDQLKLGPLTYTCRRTHMAGDREHEVLSHDENGRQIRITWGRI